MPLQALAFIMLAAVVGAYTPLLRAARVAMVAAETAVTLQVLERLILAAAVAVADAAQTVVLAARAL
jgi:hypothetical protein